MRITKILSIQDALRLASVNPQRKYRVSPNDSVNLPDGMTYHTRNGDYVFYAPNLKIYWLHTNHPIHKDVNLNKVVEEMGK